MRRFFFVLLVVAVATLGFAAGEPESMTLTVLTGADREWPDGTTSYGIAEAAVRAEFPDIEIEVLQIDLSDGSTMTMDALLAAGRAPNVYHDYVGRVSKYLVPEFALPLQDVIDVSPYRDLGPYTRDGNVLGLPAAGGGQAMAINLEIMADIGYQVPDRWTIDDFLEMAALVRDYYGGEKWATGMFAGNQSGDYLINNWFAAAGAEFYADGYDYTTIATSGGAQVYEFFQHLVREGFVPPGAATLVDDDYVIQWAKGDLAATAFFETWTTPYFNSVIDQGLRDEPFPYMFVPFPRAAGVENVPSYVSSAAVVVANTGNADLDRAAALWAEGITGVEMQTRQVAIENLVASRSDVTAVASNPRIAEIGEVIAAGGVMDVGLTAPFFARVRPLHFPILQRVLNLAVEPEEAIAEYAAAIDAELAR